MLHSTSPPTRHCGPIVVPARIRVPACTTLPAPTAHGPSNRVNAWTTAPGPIETGPPVVSATTIGSIRAGTTIGPQCRVGGEVECSILLGFANKYHDGFLGHSYVGEWVNLAAGTHTSDLRCDYAAVSVVVDGEEVSTGKTKVGTVFGDHAKTGLGVLLNTGTTVGPFAQVLPAGGFAPREVPAFTRAGPDGLKELTDVARVLATADTVMRRRGRSLTPALEAVYRAAAGRRGDAPAPVLPLRRSA